MGHHQEIIAKPSMVPSAARDAIKQARQSQRWRMAAAEQEIEQRQQSGPKRAAILPPMKAEGERRRRIMRLTEEHDERLAKAAMRGHYPDPGSHDATRDYTQFLAQARSFREMFNETMSLVEEASGGPYEQRSARSHRHSGAKHQDDPSA